VQDAHGAPWCAKCTSVAFWYCIIGDDRCPISGLFSRASGQVGRQSLTQRGPLNAGFHYLRVSLADAARHGRTPCTIK
jgi:hypothetical protein